MSDPRIHKRRQIALVVHDFSPGFGHGRYCVELARRFKDAHDVHVFANHFGVAAEPGWTFWKVPAWRRSALLTITSFLASAGRKLGKRRFDIIHAQGLTCWSADVITAHICNAARLEHDTLRTAKDRVFDTLAGYLETEFYRHNRMARWIAVSQRTRAELLAHHSPVQPVEVIYHGVDGTQFGPASNLADKQSLREQLGLTSTTWWWLFAGEASKGLQPTLEALRQFPQAGLLVISRSNATAWLETASRMGLAERVCWPGPQASLAPYYRAADVLVYPSQYDAFGMVVAEAMSSGLPVIAGHSIGAAEWIVHGKNGFVINPGQPSELTNALRHLSSLPDQGAAIGMAARETALRHSWQQCADETLRLYETIWKQRSP